MTAVDAPTPAAGPAIEDGQVSFDLSTVFDTISHEIPDQTFLVWRDKRLTYAAINARMNGFAHYLASVGLSRQVDRTQLAGHESGQHLLAIYLRNSNEYLESMVGSYRARVAPFNCSYRYVEAELLYLLNDSRAKAVVYNAEFAPHLAALRDQLPHLEVLIQVADDSGEKLLPGAVDYESILATPPPVSGMATPSGDDLYILYTGGTTGMPKGVLWRQHDIFVSAMGGRPFGSTETLPSYEALTEQVRRAPGQPKVLVISPFMHGASQWSSFNIATMGGCLVIPDRVDQFDAVEALRLAERERVSVIPVVGDAVARPLVDELERVDHDLSSVVSVTNGGAALSSGVRQRILAALPGAVVLDAVGSSEAGLQMNSFTIAGGDANTAVFTPESDSAVVADDFSHVLRAGGSGRGWLARRGSIPLGYLGDSEKTARTFPMIEGERWSVPGDRAELLEDGRIRLLGRDSLTINSGGEKIFVEEVEQAIVAHPSVYDVVVTSRSSARWGNEVVAVVELADGWSVSDDELIECCRRTIARYKVPKAFVRVPKVQRFPTGKADYRWAGSIAEDHRE